MWCLGTVVGLGAATFALSLTGRVLAAVFVAGVGADRLEGAARRVPDGGPVSLAGQRVTQAAPYSARRVYGDCKRRRPHNQNLIGSELKLAYWWAAPHADPGSATEGGRG